MPLDQTTTTKISNAMLSDFDTVNELLDAFLGDIGLLAETLISAAADSGKGGVPAGNVIAIAEAIQQKSKAAQAALNP